jgi:hypothetical protein
VRISRSVLREAGGETPPAYSPVIRQEPWNELPELWRFRYFNDYAIPCLRRLSRTASLPSTDSGGLAPALSSASTVAP